MPKIKKKSLQSIEDFYFDLGYRSEKFRVALKKDKEYQKLLKEKKQKIAKKVEVSSTDKKKYVLATDADLEILSLCNALAKKKLIENDKQLVALIKSQLLDDWRSPLLKALNQLLKKYKVK